MEISFVIHFEDVIAVGKRHVANDIVHVSRGYNVTLGGTAIKLDRTLNPIQAVVDPVKSNGSLAQPVNKTLQ